MTVIAVLGLSERCGIGISDIRMTQGMEEHQIYRAYDLGETKLYKIGNLPIYNGVSGSVKQLACLSDHSQTVPDQRSYREVLEAARGAYLSARNESFTQGVLDRYGVTWEGYVKGEGVNTKLIEMLSDKLNNKQKFPLEVLVFGYDRQPEEFKWHTIVYPGRIETEHPFIKHKVIGSGTEQADNTISAGLERMRPEERNRIEPYVGAKLLLKAARTAWRNPGVGGATQLVQINGGETWELGRDESYLLNNSIFLEQNGLLQEDQVNKLFQAAVHDHATYSQLKGELDSIIKNPILRPFMAE